MAPLGLRSQCLGPFQSSGCRCFPVTEGAPLLGLRWGLGHLQRSDADHLGVLQRGRRGNTVGPSEMPQPMLPCPQVSQT